MTMLDGGYRNLGKVVQALATRRVTMECDRVPYLFENVPIKKILNWLLVESSIYLKPSRPWGWPTHVQVEPTAHCNLRCTLCPLSEGMQRPSGHMPFGIFEKLMDEIGDYLFLVLLWDWGEPFLNPRIYDIIRYARQKGIKLVSSSNGHIFADARHAEAVVRSGLDSLVFAVDGITQETYQQYRRRGDLETALEGIRRVVAQKRALDSPTPFINFRFIVMEHNEHEIPKLEELAMALGVDFLSLKALNCYSQDTYQDNRATKDGFYQGFIPRSPRYQRFAQDPVARGRIRLRTNPCKDLWNKPAVHWNGIICPCTYDYNERYVLGDLKTAGFGEIWHGSPYRRMRRAFRTGYQQLPICGDCTYAFKGGNCSTEVIAEASLVGSRRYV